MAVDEDTRLATIAVTFPRQVTEAELQDIAAELDYAFICGDTKRDLPTELVDAAFPIWV